MLIFILLQCFVAWSSPYPLTEKMLVDLSRESSPKLSEIKARLLSSVTSTNTLLEKYSPELYARGSYSETQEKPIIEFLPVFSPVKQAHMGVRQKFAKGIEAQLQASIDQRSANSPVSGTYQNVTTNILSLTLQMDLWKNLFGRFTESERLNSQLESKRAKIEEDINIKSLEFSARRLYWSLVANTEQLKVANGLKETAEAQLNDSKKRLAKAIGDSGDVARYEALLAQRKGQVIFFTYQRENLFRSLKTLLPSLNDKDLKVENYDVQSTVKAVTMCSLVIAKSTDIPWDFTRYDDVLAILKEQRSLERTMNDRYSDVDVKLFGTLKSTGVGSEKLSATSYRGSYGDAVKDMQNNNRSGYEAGLNVTIPLGSAKGNTKNSKTLYDEERLKAQINGYDAQIVSTHTQLARSMALIHDMIEAEKVSSSALEKRMNVNRRKYLEARLSVNDLIQDQDALLNSELSTIEAQLTAINILFDYLMVFTETPCDFNRI